MAQVFDLARPRLTGEATPVAEQVQYLGAAGTGVFSASHNGVLAYQASPGGELSRLVWVDREGKHLDVNASGGAYGHPRLSYDGRRVAYAVIDPPTFSTLTSPHWPGPSVATPSGAFFVGEKSTRL